MRKLDGYLLTNLFHDDPYFLLGAEPTPRVSLASRVSRNRDMPLQRPRP